MRKIAGGAGVDLNSTSSQAAAAHALEDDQKSDREIMDKSLNQTSEEIKNVAQHENYNG